MKKRGEKDIWNGLYDFYLIETKRSTRFEKLKETDKVLKGVREKDILYTSKRFKHVLSHQIIQATFTVIRLNEKINIPSADYKFYSAKKIEALPKPVLITRFLKDHDLS